MVKAPEALEAAEAVVLYRLMIRSPFP